MNDKTRAEVDALVAALRAAGSMTVIEWALDEATRAGDGPWPNSDHEFPNPAFVLAMEHLLMRDPVQARIVAQRLTEWAAEQ